MQSFKRRQHKTPSGHDLRPVADLDPPQILIPKYATTGTAVVTGRRFGKAQRCDGYTIVGEH